MSGLKYDKATGCDYVPGPNGAWALLHAIIDKYRVTVYGSNDQIVDHPYDVNPYSLGVYNCRPPRGTSRGYSEHAESRALDIGLNANDPQDRAVADQICHDITSLAARLGVQSIIWNRRVWGYGRWYWRRYTGINPHTDHIHIGINRWAQVNLTPEFVRSVLSTKDGDMTPEQNDLLISVSRKIDEIWHSLGGDQFRADSAHLHAHGYALQNMHAMMMDLAKRLPRVLVDDDELPSITPDMEKRIAEKVADTFAELLGART